MGMCSAIEVEGEIYGGDLLPATASQLMLFLRIIPSRSGLRPSEEEKGEAVGSPAGIRAPIPQTSVWSGIVPLLRVVPAMGLQLSFG